MAAIHENSPVDAPPTLPFGLDKVQLPTSSPVEASILAILVDALQSKDPDVERVSMAAAVAINMLCPSIDTSKKNTAYEAFLWSLWTLLLATVRVVPHDAEHPGQATLVGILDALHHLPRGTVTLWGAEMQLWRDLPLFVARFTESNARPLGDGHPEGGIPGPLSEDAIWHWRNQSAFSARCLQAGLARWYDHAIYGLRDALEGVEGDEDTKDIEDDEQDHNKNHSIMSSTQRCALLAATEWAIHCSKALFQRAKDSDEDFEDRKDLDFVDGQNVVDYERDEDIPPGPLLAKKVPGARAGLSGVRWTIWKEQFRRLLLDGERQDLPLTEDVHASVRLAVEHMERAEKEVAEQEAEELRKWEMEHAGDEEDKEDEEDEKDEEDEEDEDDARKGKADAPLNPGR